MAKKLLLIAAVGWGVFIAVLLVEIRNDVDDTADAILLQDGQIADGVWLAVHSRYRPVLVDGTIHSTAPGTALNVQPAPSTTTAAPTTTAKRVATTTRRRTTTTASPDRCAGDIADVQATIGRVRLELDSFAQTAAVGDVWAAQAHYENAQLLGEVVIDEVDAFLSRCGDYARSAGAYNELRQGSSAAKSALEQMRRTCRAELAALGFDC